MPSVAMAIVGGVWEILTFTSRYAEYKIARALSADYTNLVAGVIFIIV